MGRVLALIIIAGALGGCADLAPSVLLPEPGPQDRAAAAVQPLAPTRSSAVDPSFEILQVQDQRVANIAFRLSSANADLCPDRALSLGLTLHTLSQYGGQAVPELADLFPGGRPAVLAVAKGGPADQAGLQADDVLVAVNGQPFAASRAVAKSIFDDTEAANRLLAASLTQGGPASLVIERDRKASQLVLHPVLACAYQAGLLSASKFEPLAALLLLPRGASGGEGQVTISLRLAIYARDDDELAVEMAHEYAHNLLHHGEKLKGAGDSLAAIRRSEAEADYVGLYLAARAGYDIAKAAPFLARSERDFPSEPITHSSPNQRIALVLATVREIAVKRAAGQPLIPNPAGP